MTTSVKKFENISFPIFTTERVPFNIIYDHTKIQCQYIKNGIMETIDDKSLKGDYFSRLFQLDTRFIFHNTCRNVQDLIYCKAKWGMDAAAMPHNFSKLDIVPSDIREIIKTKQNLFWLKNISYPFEIMTKENITLNDKTYARIVLVNKEWYIKEFLMDRPEKRVAFGYV